MNPKRGEMKIPSNHTEQEVIDLIVATAKRLAPRYIFPGNDLEDIEQQGMLLGIEALEKYDESYSLKSFLFRHINNRLQIYKRDEYYRLDEGPSKEIQTTKRRINAPETFAEGSLVTQEEDDIARNEINDIIDKNLPMCYRSDYLRFTNGEKISETRKEKLLDVLREIVKDYDYGLQ
jgi:DNA-directed RNA polymerase specialized sigma subunit